MSVYARAAGACVQVDECGTVLWGLTFAVPRGMPQTGAAAVHLCVWVCQAYAEAGIRPITDSGSVYRSAVRGQPHAAHEKRPWAAIWADIGGSLGPGGKVTAHLSLEASTAAGQAALWRGNAAADAAA